MRLHTRNTDDPVEIERRLANARKEVLNIGKYQYAVINDDLDLAFSQLQNIVNAEKQRTNRFIPTIAWKIEEESDMAIVNPTIVELCEKVDCRYTLVVEASKRARQLLAGS